MDSRLRGNDGQMKLDLKWDTRPSNWWVNRLKPKDSHVLTMHNVYVLPARAGWMMLVTVAVLMLATINYQLSLGYVLIFLLMGAGVVGLFLAHRALTRITLLLPHTHEQRGKAGEEIAVDIQIDTTSAGGVQSRLESLALRLGKAGSQSLPRLVCETRYPLGLLRLWSVWRPASSVQIDPPDSEYGTAASHSQWAFAANHDAVTTGSIDGIKTDIRAYRVGDAPRDVLWKTVAKRPDTPSNWGVRAVGDEPPEAAMRRAQPRVQTEGDEDATHQQVNRIAKLRDLSLLLALLFIALPFFQHLFWWYPLFGCSLIVWRLWHLRAPQSRSPKWLQLPLVMALGVLVWLPFRGFSGIEASVSACIGLLGIKALELPQQQDSRSKNAGTHKVVFTRDHWVLIFLGLFTLSAHFLVSQSLISSVQVVLGLAALLFVLVLSHSKLAARPSRIWARPVRITLILVVCGAPFMAVMFFLFPRFAPLWSLQEQKNIAQTGLTSEMRVGDMSEISRDNKIVLRLQMDAPPVMDSKDIYLRSYVLPRFDGRTWTSYRQAFADAPTPKPLLESPEHAGRAYTVTMEGDKPYRAVIAADSQSDAESLGRSYLQAAASLPAGSNPRTSQWLQGLRADAQFQTYSIQQWSHYLLSVFQSGGYRYTLAPGSYGKDLVDELLFDRKLGFCEHYATAYVVAMRSLGIPARVVTGYQGAEINPIDGLQVVRNSNAHAWAEYWDGTGEGVGVGMGRWHRVDPTAVIAPARIQNAESYNFAPQQLASQGRGVWSSSLLAPVFKSLWRARQSWEATNHAWEAWFAGYNPSAQLSLLKKLGIDDPSWKDLVQLLDAALLALLLIAVGVYALRGRVRKDPWMVLVQAIRDRASQQGAALPENATLREMASKYPQHQQWLMALEALRYAPLAAQKTDLATLKQQSKKLFRAKL
jgi:transglutaminase-like putative cysteine protease